ncbi:hypothetical protein EVB79_017 [Rhizobium phage RHph_N3_13]|nr:hypothetical protein EVB79_017 [Rhizobium phage RHph_N3_13]QIG69845.1 hypothetical protein F67_I3_11_019 [Rhizobium phage RHph_I3_11]
MKYRPNLWSTVDRIQTAPDMRRTVYIPEVHFKKDRELKNAFRS